MHTLAPSPALPLPLPQLRLKRDVVAALITGQLAGLIMAGVLIGVFIALGKPFYLPVQVIGSFVFGDTALFGFHAPAFITGLLLHQAGPALVWAALFGLVINKWDFNAVNLLGLGLALGVLSEVVDVKWVMPKAMTLLHGHDLWTANVPDVWSWAAHLVFGLSFVLFPAVRARVPLN